MSSASPAYFQQLRMIRGDGQSSYHARCSQFEGDALSKVQLIVFEGIKYMSLPDPGQIVRIADLGCWFGPNVRRNVEAVIEKVQARYSSESELTDFEPEFQVFFQDLRSEDFNKLIKLLFSRPHSNGEKRTKYMSAVVPGSCYDRLFPSSTINIAMSSFALHWLSEIPAAVIDRMSPAYNGGHTELHRSTLATVDAYAEQSDKDLEIFLAARAAEIVPGGLLLLIMGTRENYFPYRLDFTEDMQEDVWDDLVSEGSISEETRDSYNTPIYFRTLTEVNKQLERYSSMFAIRRQHVMTDVLSELISDVSNIRERAGIRAATSWSLDSKFFEAYVGENVTKRFYQRYEQALSEASIEMGSKYEQDRGGTRASFSLLVLVLQRI